MKLTQYPRLEEQVFRQVLPNGLTLMVLPRKGFTHKTAYFVTNFGAVHTEFTLEGQKYRAPDGIAHFLEHKLFDMPGRDVTAELAALGASVNAFTSYDMTAYYFSCTENFYESLRILLEFVCTPYFTEESVHKELGIIDQEIGMVADTADNQVYEQLMAAAYEIHPIRIPILGTRESIRQITPELLTLVHRAFYAPGNMILCVAGDVDEDQVARLARQVLGDTPREVGQKLNHWDESLTPRTREIEGKMDVVMPMFHMIFKTAPVPSGEEGFRREMEADLACELLLGGSSELYQRLYREGIIDSSFGGGFEVVDGCAMISISGDSYEPRRIREEILKEAKRLVQEGIPEGEFRRLLRADLGSHIRGLDSFSGTCYRLFAYHMTGFDYLRFPESYENISLAGVKRFLEKVIREEHCALSIIYPTDQEERP